MSRPEPSTNLPAPYRSPWRALAEDLRAVAASLRLGLQELWRRNGQGDLPRPAPWPRDLAPLFWPLLLALALAALVLMGLGLGRMLGGTAVGAREPASPAPPADIALENPQERPGTSPATGPAGTPTAPRPGTAAMESPATSAADATAAPVGTSRSAASTTPEPDPSVAEAAPTAGATPEAAAAPGARVPPDPLAELLASPAAAGLLRSASAEPASASLQLVLAEGFHGLPLAEQQRRADAWQQLALGLGYEHLQLRDAQGALLGREAVVGGGMILLSPPERD
jgi:hypothetical protein